jgi:hypothetical protein
MWPPRASLMARGLTVLAMCSALLDCRKERLATTAEVAPSSPPCSLTTVVSAASFHFSASNEWFTGKVVLGGCSKDAADLRTLADWLATQQVQAFAEEKPPDLPVCNGATSGQFFIESANRRYGRRVVWTMCVKFEADI